MIDKERQHSKLNSLREMQRLKRKINMILINLKRNLIFHTTTHSNFICHSQFRRVPGSSNRNNEKEELAKAAESAQPNQPNPSFFQSKLNPNEYTSWILLENSDQ